MTPAGGLGSPLSSSDLVAASCEPPSPSLPMLASWDPRSPSRAGAARAPPHSLVAGRDPSGAGTLGTPTFPLLGGSGAAAHPEWGRPLAPVRPRLEPPRPPPAPSPGSSSCQWLRLEVQVRRWRPARLPCVCLVKEEASPPLESFTLSSLLLSPRLPRGFGVSRSLSVSLFSPAPIGLQCVQCSLQIPHCTLILFLCL